MRKPDFCIFLWPLYSDIIFFIDHYCAGVSNKHCLLPFFIISYFGFEGRILVRIVLVPGHCLFYLNMGFISCVLSKLISTQTSIWSSISS